MNKHNDNTATDAVPSHRPGRRWLLALTLAVAAGASLAAGGSGILGHHRAGQHMAMDPAAMDKHIDKMIEQVLPDGTPEQKTRIAAIARSACADLRPAHDSIQQGHARVHELLMAPVIDRAALEQLRSEQMQQMDLVSKRMLAALEDAADVLNPAQRARLAEHLAKHMH
jgi:protein CpxP